MTRPPSALSSILVLARVTWTRLFRGRALVVSMFIAALPCLYALVVRGANRGGVGDELFAFAILVLAILAPMYVASSIGEEIEDRTATYLWSRPIPRWAILVGKLTTLVPVVIAISCASWAIAAQVSWSRLPPAQTFLALALGAKCIALLATALATVAPKHGMALTICYLLFIDVPMGVLPAAVQELSITHQLRTLSGMVPTDGTFVEGLIGIIALTIVWTLIAAARIRRLEA